MRWSCYLAVICTALVAAMPAQADTVAPAFTALRSIPPQARSAKMGAPNGDRVSLNGKPFHLAAGAQIRDARNLIVLPISMQNLPDGINVRYLLDMHGDVVRIWMLTPEEAGIKFPGDD